MVFDDPGSISERHSQGHIYSFKVKLPLLCKRNNGVATDGRGSDGSFNGYFRDYYFLIISIYYYFLKQLSLQYYFKIIYYLDRRLPLSLSQNAILSCRHTPSCK